MFVLLKVCQYLDETLRLSLCEGITSVYIIRSVTLCVMSTVNVLFCLSFSE